MYKLLFVLVALAVCVFATTDNKQLQETAERFFRTYGTNTNYHPKSAYTGASAGAYAAPHAYSGYKTPYPYAGYGYNPVY